MGGVGKALFGGEDAKSGNANNTALSNSLAPTVGYANQAGGLMSSLLGGNTDALNSFANSGGMQFLQQQGDKAITSNKAASGLLGSGSYGMALEKYNQGIASTYLNDYMSQLNNLGTLGLGAGGVLSDSGKTSTDNRKNGIIPGISGMIKAGASAGAGGGGA